MDAETIRTDLLLATRVDAVGRQFISLADALASSPRFSEQITNIQVEEEFSRFKLWSGNVAAHRKGHRSLEYRLRDATLLKTEIHGLLGSLSQELENALEITIGQRTPWDECIQSDSESDDECLEDSTSNSGDQDDTELKQIFTTMRTVITCLFRLAMAIRNPAKTDQLTSGSSIDKSMYKAFDLEHVRNKFPKCPEYLRERLGQAITARRRYLSYREEHHKKLAKNAENIGLDTNMSDTMTNSTQATQMRGTEKANGLSVSEEDWDSASQTSYATSVNATIKVPSLPKEAHEKEFFECPLCFLLVSIHDTNSWKQHVYRDLHPYCCTHENCTTPNRLYDSRKAWFMHELEAHHTIWQCVEGCDQIFQDQAIFEDHVLKKHIDLSSAGMLSALKRTSVRRENVSHQIACALCKEKMSLQAFQKHMGSHQQQLALFALPSFPDDAEGESDQVELLLFKTSIDEDDDGSSLNEEPNPEEEQITVEHIKDILQPFDINSLNPTQSGSDSASRRMSQGKTHVEELQNKPEQGSEEAIQKQLAQFTLKNDEVEYTSNAESPSEIYQERDAQGIGPSTAAKPKLSTETSSHTHKGPDSPKSRVERGGLGEEKPADTTTDIQAPRESYEWGHVWFCSECGDGPTASWQRQCISCNHVRCQNCKVEYD